MQSSKKTYTLNLADGSVWHIKSDDELCSWLDEFASIMGLKSDDGRGIIQLTFIGNNNNNFSRDPDWKIYKQPSLKLIHDRDMQNFICKIDNTKNDGDMKYVNMWISLQSIYLRAIENKGVPFHAALIERKGLGIIIAGEGDTGKSTSAKRLQDIWKPLCDDETLVVYDNGIYRAHPFPTWSDYIFRDLNNSWDVGYSVPLSAIFFLKQSQTDEVQPLSKAETALMINSSAQQVCNHFLRDLDVDDRRAIAIKIFENSCKLAENIPAFILKASKNGRFWEEMEKVI